MPIKNAEQLGLTLGVIKLLQEKSCGHESDMTVTYKDPKAWMLKKYNFYFPDLTTLDLINSEMRSPTGRQHIALYAELKDAGGGYLGIRCTNLPLDAMFEYTRSMREVESIHGRNFRPRIHGETNGRGTLRVHAEGLDLSQVATIDFHIEKDCN